MLETRKFLPMRLSLCLCGLAHLLFPVSHCTQWQLHVSHFLVLKHLKEKRWEEFVGTLHLHVKEAAGVARPNHSQVRHLHQKLGPEVGNVVLAVIDVVLKCQQVSLLTLLYLVHTGQA
ncbi:hypothetical protein XENORESO_009525 [Xenotaenia resolanae]|uniref:Secreted protein n=1 Tax=Xenotaenia resolanae TaxID=208358 RepID=A0ABV0W4Z0_9TELE